MIRANRPNTRGLKFVNLLFVSILILASLMLSSLTIKTALAEESIVAEKPIELQVPLGGITHVSNIGEYIVTGYQFALGIAGIIAVVMMMIGGVIWITSAGNPTKVTQAKDYIFTSIVGLILLIGAYTILKFINPSLTVVGINVPKRAGLLNEPVPKVSGPQEVKELSTRKSTKVDGTEATVQQLQATSPLQGTITFDATCFKEQTPCSKGSHSDAGRCSPPPTGTFEVCCCIISNIQRPTAPLIGTGEISPEARKLLEAPNLKAPSIIGTQTSPQGLLQQFIVK